MTQAPIFILGVGGQRTGTTWLHRMLSSRSDTDMGPIKEYRIWDVVHTREGREASVNISEWWHRPGKEWLRWSMRRRPGYYERFFQRRIALSGATITGDITPYYALLNGPQLAAIKTRLESVGFDVRAVFFLRDPVSRVVSAARYFRQSASGRRQKSYLMTPENRCLSEGQLIEKAFDDPHFTGLTRYENTLQALDDAFAPGQVFTGLYETLFTLSEQERLARFLDLDGPATGWERPINASRGSTDLDAGLARRIATYYQNTYNVCGERFPETQTLWYPKGFRVRDQNS